MSDLPITKYSFWRILIMKMNLQIVPYIVIMFSFCCSSVVSANGSDAKDSRISFNKGWLFSRFGSMPDGSSREEPPGLENPNFNDADWRKLNLPHDWGIEGPFRMDLPSSTGKLPWAGIGWYRKHFTLSSTERGKLIFVDFDGAMSHAKVWLNGKYIGEWPYGYASFRFELTPSVNFDKENVLTVRLENPPNSSRWYPGSGIYRNVWLIKTSPLHIAHWGTFITTPIITQNQATLHIRTEIENQSAKNAKVVSLVKITEYGKNNVVGLGQNNIDIPRGQMKVSEFDIILMNPQLWNLESSTRYQAYTYIQQDGQIIDSAITVFGIRTAQFTPDNGFVLNGKRIQIKGVCNHHDLGILGTAVNEKALERQMNLLREVGCNAIRTSHNPPSPELLNLCDRMGILVLDEAFDCWEHGKTTNDYSTLFKEWHEKDIKAFVRRDRNHPCVIGWSAGNEVREQNDSVLVQKLKEIFKSEDPTRQVTAGCDKPEAGFNGFQNAVDFFGYNYKPHLYKKFHEENPDKPLYGSETASCVSTFGEYFFPVGGDRSKSIADDQVSSYDLYTPWWATIPDIEFEGQDRNLLVAGEFVWTGFDYLGEPAPFFDEKSISRSSYFGIFDLCGFKKDRFYLYQARWLPDLPMAHILPHWTWPERIGMVTPVYVYTSGDEAELYLNGTSLGRKKKEPFQYRLCWDSVKYEPGELKVIAFKDGKEWATDLKKTSGPAFKLQLSIDTIDLCADGKDLAFISLTILDKNDLVVPTADNLVRFKVSGPGVITAVGNGDPTNHNSFQSDKYKAFHGQCLLIVHSTEEKGLIHVIAESDTLTSVHVVIQSR
jgi:beta-galactosidase